MDPEAQWGELACRIVICALVVGVRVGWGAARESEEQEDEGAGPVHVGSTAAEPARWEPSPDASC